MRYRSTLFLLTLLLMAGCELFGEDDAPTLRDAERVVVGNGGNFSDQNGFLTVYDPDADAVTNLEDLGGFVQSLALRDARVYVAINTFGTGRIDVVDLGSGERVGQVQNVPAPRYLAFAGEKAYATNFVFGGPGTVSVIDLATNTITKSIDVGGSPEGIVAIDGRLYVANYGNLGDGNTISVIDASTDTAVDTITLACDGPKDLLVDGDGDLVVICQGKTVFNDDFTAILEQTNGQVLFLDPETGQAGRTIAFDVQLGSSNFTQSAYVVPEDDVLYVLSGSASRIYRIDTDDAATSGPRTFQLSPIGNGLTGLNAVAYDAATRRLYVARNAVGPAGAPDVTAAGGVLVLDADGNQMGRFTAGPAPSHIVLR